MPLGGIEIACIARVVGHSGKLVKLKRGRAVALDLVTVEVGHFSMSSENQSSSALDIKSSMAGGAPTSVHCKFPGSILKASY